MSDDKQCALCESYFTVNNRFAGNLPVKVQYPGGEENLPLEKDEGPICERCLNAIVECIKEANKASGIQFDGKDAHLND